jgi:hypothetical protein
LFYESQVNSGTDVMIFNIFFPPKNRPKIGVLKTQNAANFCQKNYHDKKSAIFSPKSSKNGQK